MFFITEKCRIHAACGVSQTPIYENLKKGEPTQKANIRKQKLKVQKLHQRLENIRTDYINKTISETVECT